MNPVNWFEIPAKDLDRAKEFYSSVFGYEMQYLEMPDGSKMHMFAGDPNNAGALGAIYSAENMNPSTEGTTIYFGVEDCDNEVAKVKEAGGSIVFPKTSIGEFGFIAQFLDTEGNRIGIHSHK